MSKTTSKNCKFFIYFFTVVAFICTILVPLFGALTSLDVGIFDRSVGNTSDRYFLELTPSSYVFGTIWPIIFLWTIVGNFYLVVSLFLPANKSPVKMNPILTPISYFIFHSLSFLLSTSWYFAFNAESLGWTFAILLVAVICVCTAIGITLNRTAKIDGKSAERSKATVWLVRILLQNGLCVYATWITCATTLSLVILLVYVDSPDFAVVIERGLVTNETGSTIGLAILLTLILVWFLLENFLLEKYLRHIFTIYPVFILAFSGVVYKLQKSGSKQNLIFSTVNLGVSTVLLLVRIALSVHRYRQRRELEASKTRKSSEI